MTTRETTLVTGVSGTTVNAHIRRGELPAEWDGRRWSIDTADAIAWARREWTRGKCIMFPPNRIRGNISLLQDLRARRAQETQEGRG